MLSQSVAFAYELVIVDYGCPDGTFEWCIRLQHPKVRIVRVLDDTLFFNLSRARNIGAVHAKSDTFAFVDGDVRLKSNWLAIATSPLFERTAGLSRPHALQKRFDRYGTCCVLRTVFESVRGYDESLQGWGFEDMDFYRRCQGHTQQCRFDGQLIDPIPHSDAERVRFYRETRKHESRKQNRLLAATRRSIVNPNGYGRSQVEVHEFPTKQCFPS
jgi:glycosyltransferase involved in cell wall biosynthesis